MAGKKYVALGTVRLGRNKDGESKVIEDGGDLSNVGKDLLEELKKAGVAVTERAYARVRPDDEEDEEDEDTEDEAPKSPPASAGQQGS
jgi:hypothetical protein